MIIAAVFGLVVVFMTFGFLDEWWRTKKFPSDGLPLMLGLWASFIVGLFAWVL